MNTISITAPYVVGFSDYHEISSHAELMSKLTGTRIRCAEIDTDVAHGIDVDEFYLGVFYIGRRPSSEQIVDALVTSRIEFIKPLGYYPRKIAY